MTDSNTFIVELNHHVGHNYRNPRFNVAQLCEILRISRASMYRKIIYTCQCTPQEYIDNIRLQTAVQKIQKNKDISITELANEVGYKDSRHFSFKFKQRFGTNPSKFRKTSFKLSI